EGCGGGTRRSRGVGLEKAETIHQRLRFGNKPFLWCSRAKTKGSGSRSSIPRSGPSPSKLHARTAGRLWFCFSSPVGDVLIFSFASDGVISAIRKKIIVTVLAWYSVIIGMPPRIV